jgi:hypothetical protein
MGATPTTVMPRMGTLDRRQAGQFFTWHLPNLN